MGLKLKDIHSNTGVYECMPRFEVGAPNLRPSHFNTSEMSEMVDVEATGRVVIG